jgi:integrase
MLLLYGCGLRTAEVCALDLSDIDKERKEVIVRRGKNDIARRIPVPAELYTEILAYLAQRGGVRGPLFKTFTKRKRISSKDVLSIVRGAVKRSGLKGKITPKTLRHTFASHLMDAGVNVAVIAVLMGHRTPRDTGVYIHALKGKKEDAIKKMELEFNKEDQL